MLWKPRKPYLYIPRRELIAPGERRGLVGNSGMMGAAGSAGGYPDLPTTNLIHHWDAALGLTKDGGNNLSQWDDQIGSADWAQDGDTPLWVAGAVNGLPSIRFDGTDDSLDHSTAMNVPMHIFMVLNQISWSSSDIIMDEPAGDFELSQRTSTPQIGFGLDGTPSNVSLAVGTWGLIHFLNQSTVAFISVNDGGETAVSGNTSNSAGLNLGAKRTDARFSNIEVAEIAVYSAEVTGSPLTDARGYFEGKFNLTY